VDGRTLLLILVPFAFLAGGLTVFMATSARHGIQALEEDPEHARVVRPWWGNPLAWVIVCGILAFLGLVVAPRLFGVAFLLLPFIWIGGFRRREPR
jgi:hypothetical protein